MMDTHKVQLIFLSCWTFFLVLHLAKAKPSGLIEGNDLKRNPVAGDRFYLKECNSYYDCYYGQICDEEFHLCVKDVQQNSLGKRDVRSQRGGYFPISECYSDYECDDGMKCDSQFGFCVAVAGGEGRL